MRKISSLEDFIEYAVFLHGNRYDYSKVEYKNNYTNVTIVCKKHGDFQQKPNNHLRKQNCPKCLGRNLTQNEFIKELKERHGERYDYSKVNYITKNKKIDIICPKSGHGLFTQKAGNHHRGDGCPKCSGNKKLITKDFIERAKLTHGNKYDYSKVKYVNQKTKVKILCLVSDHGYFEQLPDNHTTHKQGCPRCHGYFKTSTSFIDESRTIHGDRYDYSKVDYIDTNNKIIITCQIHGDFKQLPGVHLMGSGCPKCGGTVKSSTEEFIEKAKKVHGNKYDYSKVDYINAKTKVIINCPIPGHGDFQQVPANHLNNRRCPVCYGNKYRTRTDFIKDAIKIHGNIYDYSKVDYINNTREKVKIICKKHGEFLQMPIIHLKGHRCPGCSNVQRLSNKQFIAKATKIHKGKYGYSKTKHINIRSYVVITCPDHGDFKQLSGIHLGGSGCQVCANEIHNLGYTSKFIRDNSINIDGIFYIINMYNLNESFFKIGITSRSIERRYSSKKNFPYEYEIILSHEMKIDKAFELEQHILSKYKEFNYFPRKHFDGITECLTINPVDFDDELKILHEQKKYFEE
jgi:hypothetical protein